MKQTTLMLVGTLLLSAFCLPAQANKTKFSASVVESSKAFEPGTKVLNLGIGFGARNYYNYSNGRGWSHRTYPAFSLSYEQALNKPVGPGLLGLGAYLGYQRSVTRYDDYYYNNNKYYYEHSWTNMFIAFRAAYHADALVFDKGEIYFGASLGLRFQTYKYFNNSPDPDKDRYRVTQGSTWPGYSVFAGGRYYFTNNLGAFAEIGYGMSYLNLGLSLKF